MAGISKRELLGASLGASLAAGPFARAVAAAPLPAIAPGRFQPTVESLKTYQTPDWFRDAKFGIWAHWGPQAVPRQGDWYARFMYVPGHPHYDASPQDLRPSVRSSATRTSFRCGRRRSSIPKR